MYNFFVEWARLTLKILVPGGHAFIASTPLLSDVLSSAMRSAGFERRGEIIRTVSTLRGGDRPKGAEKEFEEVSVMPKGMWEPWGLYRKPLAKRTVAENLRRWNAGALRRIGIDQPFCDLIESGRTMDTGIILDPFAGSGSTLAAAHHLSIECIGIEKDAEFYTLALEAIPKLSALYTEPKVFSRQTVNKRESEVGRQALIDIFSEQA